MVSELNKGNKRLSSHPPQSSQSFSCKKKSTQFLNLKDGIPTCHIKNKRKFKMLAQVFMENSVINKFCHQECGSVRYSQESGQCCGSTLVPMRIRNLALYLNAGPYPYPDPGSQTNADPCGSRSRSWFRLVPHYKKNTLYGSC